VARGRTSNKRSVTTAALVAAAVGLCLTLAAATYEPRGSTSVRHVSGRLDLAGVVETVSHHVAPRRDSQRLAAHDHLYSAEFGRDGLTVSLRDSRFGLDTSAVRFGAESMELSAEPWRNSFNTATRTLTAGLRERVTALDGKLEWEFVLSEPPKDSGPLSIEASVRAEGAPKRSGRGPRWPLARGRSVAVGELVVKDAAGRSLYRALPVATDRTLALTVPARVLRGASYPLTLDPVISPEYPVTDVVYGSPAPDAQTLPTAAFDGTNYLVTWSDNRDQPPLGPPDIFGARVTPSGAVLDPAGIAISKAPNGQYTSNVVFDGTTYFVVWSDTRSGESDLYGAHVATSGTVLEPEGIAISTAPHRQEWPVVTFGAGTYVVAWDDDRTTTDAWDVYAGRVSQSGTVLDPSGIPVATLSNNQLSPAVTYQGGNYLVAWQEMLMGGDIYGARLSPDGTLLDDLGFPISNAPNSQWAPNVAFDGTNALVVWSDGRSGNGDIYGARVSQAGSVLDPQGIAISTNSSTQFQADVAYDGSNYMAVWRDERAGIEHYDIYGARISPAATVLDPAGIPIATGQASQEWPSVAGGGAGFLVSWEDDRDPRYYEDIFAARVTHTGEVLDSAGLDVSTVANRQETPSAAFDGANYLVAWHDDRNGSERDIYGARVTQAGSVLDPAGMPISTAPGDQFTPDVAFGGDEFLITWEGSPQTSTRLA
jgi:phosphoribosylformylglycinamidine (FGAM) synthase PurS component